MNPPSKFPVAIAAFLCGAFLVSSSHAATIGYWRFEDSPGFLADSSENGLTLTIPPIGTNAGQTRQAPVQTAIGETGPGSNFPNPVPNTGLPNTGMANLRPDTTIPAGWFNLADSPALAVSSFTIEMFANHTNRAGNQYLASHWGTTGDQRSWSLRVDGNGILIAAFSPDGTNTGLNTITSSFTLTTGVDYYVGLSFDLTNQASGVTFYLQNLTAGTPLQSSSYAHTLDTLHDSTASFNLGSFNRDPGATFRGYLDEVRYSNTVLGSDQLLVIAIPEPSTGILIGAGLLVLVALRRRQRTRA